MEYRGKRYLIAQGIEPNSWKWSVDIDDHTIKSGEATSRGDALSSKALRCQ
jgi:hypothetical protein